MSIDLPAQASSVCGGHCYVQQASAVDCQRSDGIVGKREPADNGGSFAEHILKFSISSDAQTPSVCGQIRPGDKHPSSFVRGTINRETHDASICPWSHESRFRDEDAVLDRANRLPVLDE